MPLYNPSGGGGLSSTADNTLLDGVDFAVGTTTGTKIGTDVSQKVGFWNTTPVVQQSSADQAATVMGNANSEISALTFSTPVLQAEANAFRDKAEELADDVRALHTLVHGLRTALVNTGLIKGSA